MADNIEKMRIRADGLKDSDEGVATTVGTIMALLVFLSLLSMITQQYVPIWMEDKEAYHMDTVMGQFADLKSTVDNLIMNGYTDYPMYSSLKLGSEGVPLFASQTGGVFELQPDHGGISISFDGSSGDQRSFSGEGNLSLDVHNRYYERQEVIYENGAILLQQNQQSLIRADPALTIERHNNTYVLEVTIIDIEGENITVGGTSNIGITTELWSSNKKSFQNISDVNLHINSAFSSAWSRWLANETDLTIAQAKDMTDQDGFDFPNRISELKLTHSTIEVEVSR